MENLSVKEVSKLINLVKSQEEVKNSDHVLLGKLIALRNNIKVLDKAGNN
jgi:hypothetical protein